MRLVCCPCSHGMICRKIETWPLLLKFHPASANSPPLIGKDVRLFEQRTQRAINRLAVLAQFLQVVRPPERALMPR